MAESLLPAVSIKSQFLSLPVDAISDVCLNLSPSDVIRLSRACSGLYTLIKSLQGVWRLFCERAWLHAGPCPPGRSWYSEFCLWGGEWGQYSECYADIKRAWELICLKLRECKKTPEHIFRPGAGEEVLAAAEERLGAKLPTEYRCFLRIHDGQFCADSSSFFCSELQFYSMQDECSYLLPAGMLTEHMGLVSISNNYSQLQSFSICVTHEDPTQVGQIKCNSKESYADNNKLVSVRQHTLGPSFKVWFCRFAQEFQSYPLVEGALMRFPYSPQCAATTRGIRIQVGTAFSNVYSFYNDKLLVIYHITISMSESESNSLTSQLLTRHWFISDDQGGKQSVAGPGVVGHTPVISPGTVFTYTSGSYVGREWSLMEGYFTFENKLTGEVFDAKVPSFKLTVPPYSWIDYS